jgi:hypothetical protein
VYVLENAIPPPPPLWGKIWGIGFRGKYNIKREKSNLKREKSS